MQNKNLRTFSIIAIIAVQVHLIWYLIERSNRRSERDRQVLAQLAAEFANAVTEFNLDVDRLEEIEDHPSVFLSWKPYFTTASRELTYDGSVLITGPPRYPAELVGRLVSKSIITGDLPTPGLVKIESNQSFGSLRLKRGSQFFPNINTSHTSHTTLTVDLQGKVHEYAGYVTIDGKTIESQINVPLLFPDRPVSVGDSWGLDGNIHPHDATKVTFAGAKLSRIVDFESQPHAIVQAEVRSRCNLKKAAGGVVELPPGMDDNEFVDVTEKRTYLIRVSTSEIIWIEVNSQMGPLGSCTAQMRLAS